jgi:ubiquinone/menaquinone biosynthesis C-methylase UbiE
MSKPSFQSRTQAHYDKHPLDFLSPEQEQDVANEQPHAFRRFVEERLSVGLRVADIGCGPGRATMYLVSKGMVVTALDLSPKSLILARRRAPAANFVCATNLALPLGDGSFDAVVSDGVIHHTPDAHRSFLENARVVKAGGLLYVGVYRRRRYYFYLYTYVGVPIRWLWQFATGRLLVNATLVPIYYLVHLVKTRGKRTWHGAVNFFHDYVLTPRATFHTREEIEAWGREAGLTLIDYVENVGNVHAFVFRRPQAGAA